MTSLINSDWTDYHHKTVRTFCQVPWAPESITKPTVNKPAMCLLEQSQIQDSPGGVWGGTGGIHIENGEFSILTIVCTVQIK